MKKVNPIKSELRAIFKQKNALPEKKLIPGVNAPFPATAPSEAQKVQIARKYGMFIHFGINTFHDEEWTDGSKPVSSYNPTTIDADQWVKTAKDAGMKYIILITKHHDGFCLWDTPTTEYKAANSPNTTDVLAEVARACREQGLELGFYYSLWDRHKNPKITRKSDDSMYNDYMLAHLKELMTSYGDICELWLDGGWVKENYRWPSFKIYELVKKYQPQCQIAINWTIGHPKNFDRHLILPQKQKEGYPFRYFPSDFRLGDPELPLADDPKLFTHQGETYYLPWESTLCLSGQNKWFWNSKDNTQKSVEELMDVYKRATANDNILIINCPPGPQGVMKEGDVSRLMELRRELEKQGLL